MVPATPKTSAAKSRLQAFYRDLAELHDTSGPWDAVFITGDLVSTGTTDEYQSLTEQLGELLEELRELGSTPVVLAVPGNHDVLRPRGRLPFKLTSVLWDMDELHHALWKPDTDEQGLGKFIEEAFHSYDQWSEGQALPRPKIYKRGGLPGDFAATVPLGKRSVGVVGLNTAFLQLTAGYDYDFRDRIALDPLQLEKACGENPDAWASKHDACLLLTHHPASWLSPESRIAFYGEVMPPGRFAIHLCSNAQTNKTECMQDGPALLVQAPPFTDDSNESGYNVGTLQLIPCAEPVTLLPRRFVAGKRATFAADPLASTLPLSTFGRISPLANESDPEGRDLTRIQKRPRAPLRVEFLEIQNFRCVEQLTINFEQLSRMPGEWTCLAGINGAGKSSILQALALVLLGEPFCRELGGDRLEHYRRLVGAKREDAQIRAWVRKDRTQNYIELNLGGKDPFSSRAGSVYLQGMFDFWKDMRSRVVLAYGAARNLSDFLDTRYSSLTQDVRRLMTLFDPLTQIASAEFLLGKQSPEQKNLRPLFESLLRKVFGETLGMETVKGRVVFTTTGEPVEAIDLPDGFRSTIAWLADLCSCWCEKSPKQAAGGKPEEIEAIVLIDEIDLHLHPSLQRTIVPQLRQALPRVQWVVSTHSPLVLSSFDTAEIVALDRTVPGGVRFLDRQILGLTTDQVYEWLMETPPTSAALEHELAKPARKMSISDDELEEMLLVSPDVNSEGAKKLARERKERLKRLKS
jgi:predicted ATPase